MGFIQKLEIKNYPLKMPEKQKVVKKDSLLARPPVVVVLGHVDHGKTSILDYIRQTKVVAKESGGITQHIGAYQVTTAQNKLITFIDTPGHEAFSAMRSRGAKVADIAVLVVAADEGIKPQTKEAISHIKNSGLPFMVALNKIDKPGIDVQRVKQELAENEVFVESYGGDIPAVEVSAKTGQGIDDLLDMILLLAEMAELRYDPNLPAQGVVIESNMDANKGATATLLVKNGELKVKDIISCESTFGIIKNMTDWQRKNIVTAPASMAVQALGLNDVPFVGEEWQAQPNLEIAKEIAAKKRVIEEVKRRASEFISPTADQKVLNVILKADAIGTLEAVSDALGAINQEKVLIRILESAAGDINEGDIKLAGSANASIFGFKIKVQKQFESIAQREGVAVGIFNIIYELIQAVRESMANLLEPVIEKKVMGKLEVLASFKETGVKKVIGGKVLEGKIIRGLKVDILRDGEYQGEGKLTQLQHNKQDVSEVTKDKECGLLVESEASIQPKDVLEIYEEHKKKQEI